MIKVIREEITTLTQQVLQSIKWRNLTPIKPLFATSNIYTNKIFKPKAWLKQFQGFIKLTLQRVESQRNNGNGTETNKKIPPQRRKGAFSYGHRT